MRFHIFDTIPFLLNVQEERNEEPWRNVLRFVAVNMTQLPTAVKSRRGNINPPQNEKREYGYMLI